MCSKKSVLDVPQGVSVFNKVSYFEAFEQRFHESTKWSASTNINAGSKEYNASLSYGLNASKPEINKFGGVVGP